MGVITLCIALQRDGVTSVGVDQAGHRLYLGLEDGVLEEYAVAQGSASVELSLAARKHVSKRAVTAVHDLSAFSVLVVESEDGVVHVLDWETLEMQQAPIRHATAACVGIPDGHLPRLAVASKASRKSIRVTVFEVQPTVHGTKLPVLAQMDLSDGSAASTMAWADERSLVLCTAAGRYLLAAPALSAAAAAAGLPGQWRELFAMPEELAHTPAMVHGLPQMSRALLLVGQAGVVVDGSGSPVGNTLRLDGLPTPPRALAASGMHALVVCEDGVHVFAVESGEEVQHVPFGAAGLLRPGGGPAPPPLPGHGAGQGLAPAAPAFHAGDSPTGACAAVAGWRAVWMCLPVSLEQQVQELLLKREYNRALELTELGFRQGAPWAEEACAQAALLLLHNCRFEEAVSMLERCGPDVFQPVQLVDLFPDAMGPWLGQALPCRRHYWGLHPPLAPLEVLIDRQLARLHSAAAAGRRIAGSWGTRRGKPGALQQNGVGEAGAWAAAAAALQEQAVAGPAPHWQAADGPPPPPPDAPRQQQRARLQQQAWQSLVPYLFRARMLGGVVCLDALDTLLLLLLADLGAAREAAAFAAVPNEADLEAVAPRLRERGWHHALATLQAARGDVEGALALWRQVADGSLALPDPAAAAEEQAEALDSAAAALRDGRACSDQLALAHLPWLLAASEPAALSVLTARRLTLATVLPLLPAGGDARWRYLAHLIADEGSQDPAVHTELALELVAAVLRALPLLRDAATAAFAAPLRTSQPPQQELGQGRQQEGQRQGQRGPGAAPAAGGRRASQAVRPGSAACSGAALAAGPSLQELEAADPVQALRLRLRLHLEGSPAYDASQVLRALAGSGLHEELVVLHSKMGDHMAALRVLALTLRDMRRAEAYARRHLPPSEYRALLQLVLTPGDGQEPHFEDACYLVAALGEELDPMELLTSLPPSMPLESAVAILAPVLRDRIQRRRQGQLTKALHRSLLTTARAARDAAASASVLVTEDRACPSCHLRLGSRVFVVVQGQAAAQQSGRKPGQGPGNGRRAAAAAAQPHVLCLHCWRKTGGSGALPAA